MPGWRGGTHPIHNEFLGGADYGEPSVFTPKGNISLGEPSVTIAPGERVFIAAPPNSDQSTFVKALAQLWIWGSGTIGIPHAQRIIFVSKTPYHPIASLKAALVYPDAPEMYSDADALKALERVRLERLAPDLGTTKRWEKELALEEQWRLVLARVLLHRPEWLIYDQNIAEFDEETREITLSILTTELAKTAIVIVGYHALDQGLVFDRTVRLQTRLPGFRLPMHFYESVPAKAAA